MMVWLVWGNRDPDDDPDNLPEDYLLGVFSTEEKAWAHVDSLIKEWNDFNSPGRTRDDYTVNANAVDA